MSRSRPAANIPLRNPLSGAIRQAEQPQISGEKTPTSILRAQWRNLLHYSTQEQEIWQFQQKPGFQTAAWISRFQMYIILHMFLCFNNIEGIRDESIVN